MRLFRLFEYKILDDEIIHFGPHETAIGILGRTDYRLAADVERCVDQHGTSRSVFKGFQQRMISWIRLGTDRLNPGGIVHMSNGRKF